jgi:tetrahydrodipicolinate N-succinyltransferase
MSPRFVFDARPTRIEGRDALLAGGGWPEGATTKMVAEAYDGEHAFQLYAADHGDAGVRIAEHLTVRDGVVVASEVIADHPSFVAFVAGRAS